MESNIRPYYNLSLPERVAPFPMWHGITEPIDDQYYAMQIASPTDFEAGTIFSYVTNYGSKFLEYVEPMGKDFHPGTFPEGTPDIYLYTLKVKRIHNVRHIDRKNQILLT